MATQNFNQVHKQLTMNSGGSISLRNQSELTAFLGRSKQDFSNISSYINSICFNLFKLSTYTPRWTTDALDGLAGTTLQTFPEEHGGGSSAAECYWYSDGLGDGRPRTIKETFDCLLSMVTQQKVEVRETDQDLSELEEDIFCVAADTERIAKDAFGCSYSLDCNSEHTNAWSLSKHIYEILTQLIQGHTASTLAHLDSTCGTIEYPSLSFPVTASDIVWDICLQPNLVCSCHGSWEMGTGRSLEDDFLDLYRFTGATCSANLPDYSEVDHPDGGKVSLCAPFDNLDFLDGGDLPLHDALAVAMHEICKRTSVAWSTILLLENGGTVEDDATLSADEAADTLKLYAGAGIVLRGNDPGAGTGGGEGIEIASEYAPNNLQSAYDEDSDGNGSADGGRIILGSGFEVDHPSFWLTPEATFMEPGYDYWPTQIISADNPYVSCPYYIPFFAITDTLDTEETIIEAVSPDDRFFSVQMRDMYGASCVESEIGECCCDFEDPSSYIFYSLLFPEEGKRWYEVGAISGPIAVEDSPLGWGADECAENLFMMFDLEYLVAIPGFSVFDQHEITYLTGDCIWLDVPGSDEKYCYRALQDLTYHLTWYDGGVAQEGCVWRNHAGTKFYYGFYGPTVTPSAGYWELLEGCGYVAGGDPGGETNFGEILNPWPTIHCWKSPVYFTLQDTAWCAQTCEGEVSLWAGKDAGGKERLFFRESENGTLHSLIDRLGNGTSVFGGVWHEVTVDNAEIVEITTQVVTTAPGEGYIMRLNSNLIDEDSVITGQALILPEDAIISNHGTPYISVIGWAQEGYVQFAVENIHTVPANAFNCRHLLKIQIHN